MPELVDLYVLSRSRDPDSVSAFLDSFAPSREEAADEYEVPRHSGHPVRVFRHAEQLIAYCCDRPCQSHAIYWRVVSGEASHAMVFFLADGGIIYGLSVEAGKESRVDRLRRALAEHAGSSEVLTAWESPPPESAAAFGKALSAASGD